MQQEVTGWVGWIRRLHILVGFGDEAVESQTFHRRRADLLYVVLVARKDDSVAVPDRLPRIADLRQVPHVMHKQICSDVRQEWLGRVRNARLQAVTKFSTQHRIFGIDVDFPYYVAAVALYLSKHFLACDDVREGRLELGASRIAEPARVRRHPVDV